MSSSDYCIGIDLGTTYSCVGIYKNGSVEIISNDQGNKTTPSYVAFTSEERLIGEAAKCQSGYNPENTIFDVKRLMGRKFSDPKLQQDLKHLTFKVVNGGDDKPMIEATFLGEKKLFSPEEISAMVLTKMKQTAETYLGEQVKKAVITVPAYFNDSQRQATKDAGVIAGLEVLRIINEPTAAALAYGLDKQGDRNILIFDFGGGTLDVSVLSISDGFFEVKATNGINTLGGEDLDNNLVTFCIKEFSKKNKLSPDETKELLSSLRARRRLRTECEKAKRILSSSTSAIISLDSFFSGKDMNMTVSRAKFEELCSEEFRKCLEPLDRVLLDAKLSKNQIDDVVLVGGSTRIPKVQSLLENYFGKKPKSEINPDEAVAYGAAVQAFILGGGKDKKTDGVILVDVVPLSLGIETAGNIMTKLIPRCTTIPTCKEEIFSTYADYQPAVTIRVFQGERELTSGNELLGSFELPVPRMKRGEPKIKVKFNVDSNSILTVTATEESKGESKNIEIKNEKGRLSDEEIKKKIEEAEKYAEQDKQVRERVEAKNSFEGYLYSINNSLESLKEDQSKSLKDITKKYLDWLDQNGNSATKDEIVKKQNEAQEELLPFLKSMYDSKQNGDQNPEPEVRTKKGPTVEEVD